MRASVVFICLFLGFVSTVCTAPLPVRRSDPPKVTISVVDRSDGSDVTIDPTNILSWVQSLLDQQQTALGLPTDFVIVADNVPTKQQRNLQFTIIGGPKCMPTLPCNAVYGTGSGEGGPLFVNVTIRGDEVVWNGDVTQVPYNSARFAVCSNSLCEPREVSLIVHLFSFSLRIPRPQVF
ncbi:hypothetical protein DFH05DRAFT_212421 [Lentinula detonsa]|uniref:Uncharacterized protein n=2 Tax=Lentinula detonsa TaxID=2804962 RepID=A0A9W8NWS5_9AGAR|nr:hypothetical protein DFH05DRAFT_212421 [Lentinula detonsa]